MEVWKEMAGTVVTSMYFDWERGAFTIEWTGGITDTISTLSAK